MGDQGKNREDYGRTGPYYNSVFMARSSARRFSDTSEVHDLSSNHGLSSLQILPAVLLAIGCNQELLDPVDFAAADRTEFVDATDMAVVWPRYGRDRVLADRREFPERAE